MKKIYFLLAALFVGVLAMTFLYFSKLDADTNSNDFALNQITEKSALVFCFENEKGFYEILQGQDLLHDLLGEEKSRLFGNLGKLAVSKKFISGLNQAKINVGFVSNGHKIDFLINTQLKDMPNFDVLSDTLVNVKKNGNFFEIAFRDSSVCYANVNGNLLSISNNPKQLELAKNTKTNAFTSYITENSRQNKNLLATAYINFNQLNPFIASVITSKVNGELDVLNKQGAFASLGYNFGTQKMLFNGYTVLQSDSSYYNLFIDQKEQQITIDAILPVTTANYVFLGIENYGDWSKNLDRYLRIKKEFDSKDREKAYISANLRIDIDQIFPKYFKNEILTFQLSTGEKLGAIALTNGEKVDQLLLDLSAEYAPEIRIFKRPKMLYYYFGDVFKKFERPFFTIKDNYLVFANNASTIQSFLNSYGNGKTLAETENYKDFANQLSSSATLSFYVNASNSNGIFERQLKTPYYEQYQNEIGFRDYNAFCYQLSADNQKFASNLLILKKSKEIETDTTNTNINVVSSN